MYLNICDQAKIDSVKFEWLYIYSIFNIQLKVAVNEPKD